MWPRKRQSKWDPDKFDTMSPEEQAKSMPTFEQLVEWMNENPRRALELLNQWLNAEGQTMPPDEREGLVDLIRSCQYKVEQRRVGLALEEISRRTRGLEDGSNPSLRDIIRLENELDEIRPQLGQFLEAQREDFLRYLHAVEKRLAILKG